MDIMKAPKKRAIEFRGDMIFWILLDVETERLAPQF